MNKDIQDAYDEAQKLFARAKAIMDEFSGKEMPKDKEEELDRLLDESEAASQRAAKMEERFKKAGAIEERHSAYSQPQNRLGASGATQQQAADRDDPKAVAFDRFLRVGAKGLTPDERKTLSVDDEAGGGFTVVPMQFARNLIKFVDDMVYIRQYATVETITQSESLGVVTMDTDYGDADWTVELGTGSEDTAKLFGRRELKPHPLAKRVKVSNTLIRRSSQPVDRLVQQRLGYRIGVTQEKAFLTGDGAQKPLGLFTPSNLGIPTSRDVVAASPTAFTGDELIDCKFNLKAQYQNARNTRWIFSRETLKRIRKLKSGTDYIWAPGLAGTPATVLDTPYLMSEFAPSTFSADQYVALIGDLSFYGIVDALDMQIQVLLELYAETNQRGYIVRYEGDAMPLLGEAFSRLRLAP